VQFPGGPMAILNLVNLDEPQPEAATER